MARKKKTKRETMSEPYAVRLPKATTEQYEKLADEFDMTMSQMLRKVLCERKHFTLKREQKKSYLPIIRLMSKSSQHLNHVAHGLNSLKQQGRLEYHDFIHYLRVLDNVAWLNNLHLESIKRLNKEQVNYG